MRFEACHTIGLRTLVSLHDVIFNEFTLFKAFIPIRLNCGVVHEDIRTAVPSQEAVPFCIVEPANRPLKVCHGTPRKSSVRNYVHLDSNNGAKGT